MKKFFGSIALSTIALVVIAGNAMAYQYTLDTSGERTQSRAALAGNVKAAYYNPAGLVNLKDGVHVDLGTRMVFVNKTTDFENFDAATNAAIQINGKSLESSTVSYAVPNAAVVFKSGSGALYATLDIREGGGGGHWELEDSDGLRGAVAAIVLGGGNGNIGALNNLQVVQNFQTYLDDLEFSSYTFGITFGGAFRLNEMIAVSGGVRYLHQIKSLDAGYNSGVSSAMPDSATMWASGWQGVMGIMFTPMAGLNIAINYMTETYKMGEWEVKNRDGSTYTTTDLLDTDALSSNDWSPAMLTFGVGYEVAQGVGIMLSYNLTLDGEWIIDGTAKYKRANDASHVIGLGTEYKLMDMVAVSFGMSYRITATSSAQNNDYTDPGFNALVFGVGAVITPMQNLDIDLAFSYVYCFESEFNGRSATNPTALTQMTHNQNAIFIGLGVSYGLEM